LLGEVVMAAPRTLGDSPAPTPPDTIDVLVDAFTERSKKLRRRLRKCVDARPREVDERVHDLRVAARRALAVLDAVEPFVGAGAVKPIARRVEKALDRVGPLRDLAVERATLASLRGRAPAPLLGAYDARLRRKHERIARKLPKRLRAIGRRTLRRRMQSLKKQLRACGRKADDARDVALHAGREAFTRLRDARAAIDPHDPATLHALRIALKRFRYLMEILRPVFPQIDEPVIEDLHRLQTALGTVHDLDVLTASLAKYVEKHAPARAAELTGVLGRIERRHSSLLLSCLRMADATVQRWKRPLAPV